MLKPITFLSTILLSISVYADFTGTVVKVTDEGLTGIETPEATASSNTPVITGERIQKEHGQPKGNGKEQPTSSEPAPTGLNKTEPNRISTKPPNETKDTGMRVGDYFTIWGDSLAQWLMAFMAILATAISVYIAFIIKRTLDATAGLLAEAANTTKEAEAANLSSQRLLKQNRAWLTINPIENETFERINNITQIPIRWKNTGQSPALRLKHSFAFRLIPKDENFAGTGFKIGFTKEEIMTNSQSPIGAGQVALQYAPLTDEFIEKIRDPKFGKMLVIGTWVSYETIHGEAGYTETAFKLIPVFGKSTDELGFIFMPLETHNICK